MRGGNNRKGHGSAPFRFDRTGFRMHVPESFQDLGKGVSVGSSTSNELADYTVETFAPLHFVFLYFLVREECPRALLRLEEPTYFQFLVCADDGVGIDRQIDCQLADCRQLISGNQGC